MKKRPDLVLVIGTSLKIPGLKNMLKSFSSSATVMYLNLTSPPKEMEPFIDYHLHGECDAITAILGTYSVSKKSRGKKIESGQRKITDIFPVIGKNISDKTLEQKENVLTKKNVHVEDSKNSNEGKGEPEVRLII